LARVERSRVNAHAQRLERRLQWPLLVAALLTIPAIAIEQSQVGERWDSMSYAEWGTRLAMGNSAPGADPAPRADVPGSGWGVAPPYQP
jgi:hemoglobin